MADNDRGRIYTPEEVIEEAIRSAALELHTMLPGRILSYNRTTQRARVQLEIQRTHVSDLGLVTQISLPILEDVPVEFPGAGGWFIMFPVKQGDKCRITFAERDIQSWLTAGVEAPPGEDRTHDYSDAICHVGIRTHGNPHPAPTLNSIVLGDDAGNQRLELGQNGIIIASVDEVTIASDAGLDLQSDAGPFAVDVAGSVTLTRGANELLDLVSQALTLIAATTVTPVTLGVPAPLNNAAAITAIRVLVDAMKA